MYTNLNEKMKVYFGKENIGTYYSDLAKKRLTDLGEENIQEELLLFFVDKTLSYVKNTTGIEALPDIIEPFLVDMIAGEYLKEDNVRFTPVESSVKSITEGDISVTYQDYSQEKKDFDLMVDSFISAGKEMIRCLNTVKW